MLDLQHKGENNNNKKARTEPVSSMNKKYENNLEKLDFFLLFHWRRRMRSE